MNDSIDDQPGPTPEAEEQPASGDTHQKHESREAFRDLGDAARKAFRAGARDAKNAAKDAVPKARDEFSKGLHDIAYGFAYLATFGAAFIKDLTPDPVADGFTEGSEAGRRAAEGMKEKRRKQSEESENFSPEGNSDGPKIVPVG